MKGNLRKHNRRSIRVEGYDYSNPGFYFITVCTHKRECLFGDITNGEMVLNHAGRIVVQEWKRPADIRREIVLDEFIVMPNHFHGIVRLIDDRKGDQPVAPTRTVSVIDSDDTLDIRTARGPRPKSIGSLMAGFKCAVTMGINEIRNSPGAKCWQRNYFEHIIRDEDDYYRIREYIINNPLLWEKDRYYSSQG